MLKTYTLQTVQWRPNTLGFAGQGYGPAVNLDFAIVASTIGVKPATFCGF